MSAQTLIAVIGEGTLSHRDHAALAEEVGRRIAQAGCGLICGGLGGVMEAACRGARNAGGLTVGVLPGVEVTEANPHVSVGIPTGMGQMRNVIIVMAATREVIEACPCEAGCPSCVQSPKCGNLNQPLDKQAALVLLEGLVAS